MDSKDKQRIEQQVLMKEQGNARFLSKAQLKKFFV